MNESIACRDEHPPGNQWGRQTHCLWNVRRGFTNQFNIANRGIEAQSITHTPNLIKPVRKTSTFAQNLSMSSR